jgi:hypothetical protein
MENVKKYALVALFITLFVWPVLTERNVYAVDELVLVGVLESVNVHSGMVTVNVKSQSCAGLKRFKVENAEDVEGFAGKRIVFSIDSSVCRDTAVHRIITIRREGGLR